VIYLLLLKGNLYPNEPVGSYPWWEWAAVGVFLVVLILWSLLRRRRWWKVQSLDLRGLAFASPV